MNTAKPQGKGCRFITILKWPLRVGCADTALTVKSLIKGTPNPKTLLILVSSCRCLCSIHWHQVLRRKWRCSWSSAGRRCSNYIWVINNLIAYKGAAYIRSVIVLNLGFLFGYSTLVSVVTNKVVNAIHFCPSELRWWRSKIFSLGSPDLMNITSHEIFC